MLLPKNDFLISELEVCFYLFFFNSKITCRNTFVIKFITNVFLTQVTFTILLAAILYQVFNLIVLRHWFITDRLLCTRKFAFISFLLKCFNQCKYICVGERIKLSFIVTKTEIPFLRTINEGLQRWVGL